MSGQRYIYVEIDIKSCYIMVFRRRFSASLNIKFIWATSCQRITVGIKANNGIFLQRTVQHLTFEIGQKRLSKEQCRDTIYLACTLYQDQNRLNSNSTNYFRKIINTILQTRSQFLILHLAKCKIYIDFYFLRKKRTC